MDLDRICSLLNVKHLSSKDLVGGYHNDAALLNEKYVLRTGSNYLQNEYSVLSQLSFGPKVYLYDEQTNTLVTEFIDAPHPKEYTTELAIHIAEFLNKLHKQPPLSSPMSNSWIDEYMQSHEMPKKAQEVYSIYKQLPEVTPTTTIHGDLALENILLTQPITVIDWEFARSHTKEAELASLWFKLVKTPELFDVVLQHYTHPVDDTLYENVWIEEAMKFIVLSDKWVTDARALEKHSRKELIQRRDWIRNIVYEKIL
jgi:tRNA A-37 threonylcarbamoyl transferase component Bud32